MKRILIALGTAGMLASGAALGGATDVHAAGDKLSHRRDVAVGGRVQQRHFRLRQFRLRSDYHGEFGQRAASTPRGASPRSFAASFSRSASA